MQRMNTDNPMNKKQEQFEIDSSSSSVGERSNLNFLRSRAQAGELRRQQLPVKTALYVGFMFLVGT